MMKKLLFILYAMLLATLVLIGCTETRPETPVSELKYSIHDSTTQEGKQYVEINGYLGTSDELVIPKTIEGLPVVRIGSLALKNSAVKTVYLPKTVTGIDGGAFSDSTSLTYVYAPGVQVIGYGAFYRCTALEKIEWGNDIYIIDDYAFYGCSSLASVDLKHGLSSVGEFAFSYCTSITRIEIPSTLTKVGRYAFSWMDALSEVIFEDGIKTFDSIFTFAYDPLLTKMTIPASMEYLQDGTLYNNSLLEVTFLGDNPSSSLAPFHRLDGWKGAAVTVYYDPNTSGWEELLNAEDIQMCPIE